MHDKDTVKTAARGRWAEILSSLAGVTADFFDGKHHPCPKVGCGGKDRFRFTNRDGDGSAICNKCGPEMGDGLSTTAWLLDCKFDDAVNRVGEYLGLEKSVVKSPKKRRKSSKNPTKQGESNGRQTSRQGEKFDKQLKWRTWSDKLAHRWCRLRKRGVIYKALVGAGAKLAYYPPHSDQKVICLPIFGVDGEIVNYVLMAEEAEKVKIYQGKDRDLLELKYAILPRNKEPGWLNEWAVKNLADAKEVIKVEGVGDLLAMQSALYEAGLENENLFREVVILASPFGAKSVLPSKFLFPLAGKKVYVISHQDEPGRDGAIRWFQALKDAGADPVISTPPFPLSKDHGNDIRDWTTDPKSGFEWSCAREIRNTLESSPLVAEAEFNSDGKREERDGE